MAVTCVRLIILDDDDHAVISEDFDEEENIAVGSLFVQRSLMNVPDLSSVQVR